MTLWCCNSVTNIPLYFPKNKTELKIEALFLFAVSDTILQEDLRKGEEECIIFLFFYPFILKKKAKVERLETETFQPPPTQNYLKIVKTAKERWL